jgi:hypothetical protein
MSDKDSDNSYIWWIVGLSLLLGVIFYFSKDSIWPQLHQPVLRCLVAPAAGVVLLMGYFLLYIVLPNAAAGIIGKLFLWLTTPRFVFPISLLIALGTAICLVFGWIDVPVASYWAMITAIATGTVIGFIVVRLVRIFKSDSWILETAISLPVSIGLTYWIVITLQPKLNIWWIITAILIMLAFLIRYLYDLHQEKNEVVSNFQKPNASNLPQDVKDQILRQVRDQVGATQYNQLISSIGEDEILSQVLANMRKNK